MFVKSPGPYGRGCRGRNRRRAYGRGAARHPPVPHASVPHNGAGAGCRYRWPVNLRHPKYTGTPSATTINPGQVYSGFWISRLTQMSAVSAT